MARWAETHLDHSCTYDGNNANWHISNKNPERDKVVDTNKKCAEHVPARGDEQKTQCDKDVQGYGLIIAREMQM